MRTIGAKPATVTHMWTVHSGQRRTRRAARGKEALLAAAATVIAQRGLDQTRFVDIADATGVAISSLQYSFGAREDLLIAVVEYATEEEIHQLRETVAAHGSATERLTRLIDFAVGENGSRRESRILRFEVWRGALRDAELRSLHTRRYDAWLEILRGVLQEGIQQGAFPADLRPYDAAVEIMAVIDGLAGSLLMEHPATDQSKVQRLALDGIAALLKIDGPLLESA